MSKKTLRPAEFIKAYEEVCSRTSQTLRDFLRNPDGEHTHDLRVAIRKFRVLTDLIPKKTQSKELRHFRRRCRKLLELTSRVRDLDIVRTRLERQGTDTAIRHALARLDDEREVSVGDSMNIGLKLFDSALPSVAERKVPKVGRSLRKTLDGLDGGVARLLPAVIEDDSLVTELHTVRKNLRRLRYLLELLPQGRRNSEACTTLRRWQDAIGEIRDTDIVIRWLLKAKQTAKVRGLIITERKNRLVLYRGVVTAYSARQGQEAGAMERTSAMKILIGRPIEELNL